MEQDLVVLQETASTEIAKFVGNFGGLSDWVTAFATLALAILTFVLVIATFRMAAAMARPHVVATIESNQWGISHMDLVLENSGNAPAYDISVKITPAIERSGSKGGVPLPFSKISLMRPGQTLVSFVAEFAAVKDKTYRIEIEWKKHPRSRKVEALSYDLDMRAFDGVSHLGTHSPMIQLAEQIKHMREDWRAVAQGSRRTKVDVFDQDDRDKERRSREEQLAERRRQAEAQPLNGDS